eukprot:1191022-Prorocentrum_minimum.AAC.2
MKRGPRTGLSFRRAHQTCLTRTRRKIAPTYDYITEWPNLYYSPRSPSGRSFTRSSSIFYGNEPEDRTNLRARGRFACRAGKRVERPSDERDVRATATARQ